MKCECGNDFEGNFCPKCGRAAVQIMMEQPIQEQQTGILPGNDAVWDKLAYIASLDFKLFVGFILGALCAFIMGYVFSGLLFAFAAVLLSPVMTKRYPQKVTRFRIIVAILFFIGLVVIGVQIKINGGSYLDAVTSLNDNTAHSTQTNVEEDQTANTYVTDCEGWRVSFNSITATTYTDEVVIDLVIHVQNISGTEQMFYAYNIIDINNDGIIKEYCYSDYDAQKIASGKSFNTTVRFSFPGNANTDFSRIIVTVGNDDWTFHNK